MASKRLTVSAIVLLSVLCAASATPACYPGGSIPYNPLPSCRTYVISKTCGVGPRLPTWAMKERCCRELSNILGFCRCEALRFLMGGLVQDRPGCPREAQWSFAATLTQPEECSLGTIHGGPYCPGLISHRL